MKQKRKVKSLLSQGDGSKTFLMLSLLILGLVLCLGSLSLLTTSSVGAIGKDINNVSYSGLDDVTEVLYHMDLADPKQLDQKAGEMYYKTSEGTFYIAGPSMVMNPENPLATQKNEIGSGNFSNILGGAGNKIYSDNVSVIGGSNISVAASNDDAVVLGGEGNKIIGNGGSDPVIMIGGSDNTIKDGHDGDVIIGGSHNTIESSVSNSFILGGNRNTVSANNVIVGGSNVTVDAGTDNVFVYSSDGSSFKPNKANTFYLNVAKGLGVNVVSNKTGLSVKGPARFGTLDISEACDDNSLGVIGTWNKCLVGCTTKSKAQGKWELLDRGKICQDNCTANQMRCYNEMETLEEPDSYTSYCSKGVDTGNASPCTPVWDNYNNVVFETSLIDAADTATCPTSVPNKCIYQCNTGYHLRADDTGEFPLNNDPYLKCFKDCDLKTILGPEWASVGNNGVITHNDTVIAYNKKVVPCSYHKYSPELSSYPGYLDNGYGTKWDRNFIGMDTQRKYELPETCTNNAHQQTLVCVNGEVFIAKTTGNGKHPTTTLATGGGTPGDSYLGYEHNGYIYKTCATTGYKCDPGQYDLRENYIRDVLDDTGVVTVPSNPSDRNTVNGTRGVYKLCKDYKVDSTGMGCLEDVRKDQQGDSRAYDKHYEFIKCMNKYHPTTRTGDLAVDPRICRKECSVSAKDGTRTVTQTVWDQQSITLYRERNKDCSVNSGNDVCDHHTFTCIDGEWKDKNLLSEYTQVSCSQKGEACAGFNVSSGTYAAHNEISVYSGCHKWTAYPATYINWTYTTKWDATNHGYFKSGYVNIQDPCIDGGDHYKLRGCVNCRHANHDQFCDESVENVEFDYYCPPVTAGTVAGYRYWEWTKKQYNGTTGDFKYLGKCEFYCDYGYYPDGDVCKPNPTITCDAKPTGEVVQEETRISSNQIQYRYVVYKTNSAGELVKDKSTNWCFKSCVSGYRRVNKSCEAILKNRDCIGTLPINSKMVGSTKHSGMTPKEYIYKPDGGDCAFKCDTDYTWNGYACVYDKWNCGVCNHTVTFDGNGGTVAGPTEKDVVCGEDVILPDAYRDCHKLTGWSGLGSPKKKGDKVSVKSNLNFRAEWEYDATKCSYTCGLPAPTSTDVEMSVKEAYKANMKWTHVNETPRSKALDACEWRCNIGLDWDDNLGCKLKVCAKGNLPSNMKGVVRGAGTYRGTTDDDVRAWHNIGVHNPLQPCEWKCGTEYEPYKDSKGEERCTKSVSATCSRTERYGCEVDWNKDVDEDGYTTSVDHKEKRDAYGNLVGWTWTCKGSPKGEDAEDCHICNFEAGYKERKDADGNRQCVKCNNCAKHGFDYCFPIDFSENCDESDYYYDYGD